MEVSGGIEPPFLAIHLITRAQTCRNPKRWLLYRGTTAKARPATAKVWQSQLVGDYVMRVRKLETVKPVGRLRKFLPHHIGAECRT